MSQLETNTTDLQLISDGVDALIDKVNNPSVKTADLRVLVIFMDNNDIDGSRPTSIEIGLKGFTSYSAENDSYTLHGYEMDSNYAEITLPENGMWTHTWENLFIPVGSAAMLDISDIVPTSVTNSDGTAGARVRKIDVGTNGQTGTFIVPIDASGTIIITYTADAYG